MANLSMEEIDMLAMNEYVVLATKGGWYFDTGAMVHVCNSRDKYVEYHEVHDGKQVTMVNKNRTHIAERFSFTSLHEVHNGKQVTMVNRTELTLLVLDAIDRKSTKSCENVKKSAKWIQRPLHVREVSSLAPRDGFILNNLTVLSGKNDTRTFLNYIACDQVRLPVSAVIVVRISGAVCGTGERIKENEQKEIKSMQSSYESFEIRNRRRSTYVEYPEDRSYRAHKTDTKPNLETEIKGQFLHRIKELTFDGKSNSNPIVHIESFKEICDLFKTENNWDAIRLRLFPFTLTGEAKAWHRSLEPSSIATWEDLRSKFLSRFFPPSKIKKLRAEIRSFRQEDEGTISEAWERFKHLLNSCPSHGLNKSDQVQTFYCGLNYSSRGTLDSSVGGVFMYKTPTQGYNLLEDMLIHNIDWKLDKRLQIPKLAGKISTDFDPSEELAAMKNKQSVSGFLPGVVFPVYDHLSFHGRFILNNLTVPSVYRIMCDESIGNNVMAVDEVVSGYDESSDTKVEKQKEKQIKILRSDMGDEYFSIEIDTFCEENGIKLERTSPFTPQQNGLAEHKNGTLVEMVNCMLNLSRMPTNLWGKALLTICHIHNWIISRVIPTRPYELWKGRKPNLNYFRVWVVLPIIKPLILRDPN
ncbi:LOW QUALITY PROTEIN: hypothetical protein OSB04_029449 [Centaurea solstitialis]|uniref:Integrase catalytic domain-containing protein n=1 Tax=Centaurea solstitialis TaxID=347529 RepID=A0AA38SQ63_9ASTR|nr:LOW QUALITY PROTEIN: hypothetical protein OSB04_029449 [Centaurea solstitialis]